jgi:hypothetical protein
MSDAALVWGVAAGAGWGAVNLWCLGRLLREYLSPAVSRRRVIVWLLVKFPAVYTGAVWLLTRSSVSSLGFAVGFLLVLSAVVLVSVARLISRLPPHAADGR